MRIFLILSIMAVLTPVWAEPAPPLVDVVATPATTTTSTEAPTSQTTAPKSVETPPVEVPSEKTVMSVSSVPNPVKDSLKLLLSKIDSKVDVQKVAFTQTPISGLYEALVGSEIVYITADGRYLVVGDIREVSTNENLTEKKRGQLRLQAINNIDEKELIVFAPEKDTRYTLNVFTDVDCPYCSKFHEEINKLTSAGIKVRYLAFPRMGTGSDTFNKMVSVWCAKDRQKAITDAKAGRTVEKATCDQTVTKQYELGRQVGVSGTPSLILPSGELVPGYLPADRLIAYLQEKSLPIMEKRP